MRNYEPLLRCCTKNGKLTCGPWFGLTSCCANFWAQYAVSCAGTLCLSCASGSCVSHYEKNYGYFTQYNEKPNVKNYFTALREYKKLSFWHMQVKNKEELKNVVTEPELAEAPRVFL